MIVQISGENIIMEKMKIKTNQTTRGLSITLPVDIIDKLNLYVSSKKGINVSKTIRLLLSKFFDEKGLMDLAPELENDSFLIPVELYSDMLGIGKNAIQSRARKGLIEIVRVYDSDYIQARKDDILNVSAQIVDLKKQVKILNKIVLTKKVDTT